MGLVRDLRAINKTIQIMGSLQPGLPSPTAIPLHFHLYTLMIVPGLLSACQPLTSRNRCIGFNKRYYPKEWLIVLPCVKKLRLKLLLLSDCSSLMLTSFIIWMMSSVLLQRRVNYILSLIIFTIFWLLWGYVLPQKRFKSKHSIHI
jgi:hypothetical protein